MAHSPDELKALVEDALDRLELWPELHGQTESVHYAVEMGGKRVRPVLSLAVGEALGAPVEQVMPAALAIELVHNFSLVHDDLPSLDDDEERRGKPSVWAAYGEGTAVLAGDGLLAEAFRLASAYPPGYGGRELGETTPGRMAGRRPDARDPLPSLRDEFRVPDGWACLAGNSLGLQPRAARAEIEAELEEWARLGVEGWFESREPWLEYAGSLRGSVARLVGAAPDEV